MSTFPSAMQVPVDGGFLDVCDEGAGLPVVLLHGFPLDKTTWEAQARALRERARVIRPDLRGSGASSVTPGPYLMETLAGDIAAVLDALEIERAVIAGHSIGGYVALAFFRMYAERVSGFALVASHVAADTPAILASRQRLVEEVAAHGITPVIDAYLPRYVARRVTSERPELVTRLRAVMERTDPRGAVAQIEGMAARVPSDDILEDIDVPAVIVATAEDDWITPESLRATADRIAGAQFVQIAECGHAPMLEAPDQTTAALAALLDRLT